MNIEKQKRFERNIDFIPVKLLSPNGADLLNFTKAKIKETKTNEESVHYNKILDLLLKKSF